MMRGVGNSAGNSTLADDLIMLYLVCLVEKYNTKYFVKMIAEH